MKGTMNSKVIRESYKKLAEVVTFNYPAVGWYFSAEDIDGSCHFKKDRWVCMFMYWKSLFTKKRRLRFDGNAGSACTGPPEYFGFNELEDDDGAFIAETERFKKNRHLARKYYQESVNHIRPPKEAFLYAECLDNIDQNREIEVINLFPDPTGLTNLSVLSYYDSETNMNNVMTPFASGCEGAFTIPFNEQLSEKPKCVLGFMDSLVRRFLPKDMLLMSIPASRFMEMVNNIDGSFLDKNFENPTSF